MTNLHDLLYDHGSSNNTSGMMYTAGAGLAMNDIAVAYSVGMVDAIARRIRDGEDVISGDSVYMITFSWAFQHSLPHLETFRQIHSASPSLALARSRPSPGKLASCKGSGR